MVYRTIQKAFKMIKEKDPDTDITEYLIRKLAQQERINLIQTGDKMLVDVDSIEALLNCEEFTPKIIRVA